MCLGIPGRVVEIVPGYAGQLALVDVVGAQRRVNVGMLDAPPAAGDWVLIHMGFALEIIDAARAEDTMGGLELMGRPRDEVPDSNRIRRRYTVSGLVQGVGFRPFAYVTAAGLGLTGSVGNTVEGVAVEVEGDPDAVAEYGCRLREDAPPLAMVTAVTEADLPVEGGTGFTIAASGGEGPARTLASPDVAICAECLRELRDPGNRRYRHPFITCTNCGPRFTIITRLPYDRDATTMARFPMCAACRTEYEDPADRRFHAQPIACPDCGPRLELITGDHPAAYGEDALRGARELLAAGRIVAVKGLGGYHLACDARNAAAVAELRRRKRRGGKPFAVMAADLGTARRLATLTPAEEDLLTGIRRPIVLLPRRAGTTDGVADAVAPDNPDLGVMLPYTPLHVLLFGLPGDPSGPDVLVMTSGNLSGESIVTDDADALTRLAPLADAWLRHDRGIRVPCDDSVSRHVAGAELPIRRSRGYAPLPLALPFEVPPVLAAGADLKNTCALGSGRYAWVSQHIGDMDDVSTIEALTRTERHLGELTGVRPEMLVVDRHPEYRSGGWARQHAAGRPVRRVQHHHAHIAAVMAEHGIGADEQVIGVAFDGTGYGDDGAVWGGEVLIADYKAYRRAAHLGYVPLAGGDAGVLRPYRMALAHLRAAGVGWQPDLPAVAACPPAERDVLAHQLATGFGCVPTSSMGRLFDAVSSLAGVRHRADFEAEAAIVLEGLARHADGGDGYAFGLHEPAGGPIVADPGPVIEAVAVQVRSGVASAVIAARFHTAVATLITELAERCRAQTGLDVVVLGGGVFQNALLIDAAGQNLRERGFTVLRPRLLPPNDGGIALGQLVIGASG
ncbi:MAG: carbamoyltransferase HypF [Actinomycetota bacterium]|nr:carbamoyltransferase HypF [Actinomycetota bacterium]